MKKGCILCLLISVISLPLIAQNIIYSNLKELLAQHGDTTAVLRVEKRSRNQIVLTGGADYRITAGDDELMCRRLKKRCFAVRDEKGPQQTRGKNHVDDNGQNENKNFPKRGLGRCICGASYVHHAARSFSRQMP